MEVFIGTILPVAFHYAPRGWALCNGQLLSISQNSALFALLGTNYGGNGVTTFGLPDLRGRTLVGMGQGPGLAHVALGQVCGNGTPPPTPGARTDTGGANTQAGVGPSALGINYIIALQGLFPSHH